MTTRQMIRVCRAVLGLSLLLTCGVAGRARAEGVATEDVVHESPPAGYREAVDGAVREFDAHNYAESRSLFAQAHALYPNARTHRGLGLAEFELRNYVESVAQFEAALASTVRPLDPALRQDTQSMLARANGFVARLLIDAKPQVAKVVVDGLSVDVIAGKPLLLPVGDHLLELQVPGFVSQKRELHLIRAEQHTLTVILEPIPAAKKIATPTPAWYKSPWLWAGVGVVAAGAVAGGVGYALTRPEDSPSPYAGTAGLALKGP